MSKRTFLGGGLCAAILLLGGAAAALAQVGSGFAVDYPHVERPRLQAEGSNVRVTFRMVIPARNIQENKTIEMIPVLANVSGEASMTPITVTGKRKEMSDLRKRVLSGTNMSVMMHVVKGQPGVLDYNVSIPYAQWMSDGDLKLYLDQSKIGYNKSVFLGRIPLLLTEENAQNELVVSTAGLSVEAENKAVEAENKAPDDFYARFSALLAAGDCAGARALLEGDPRTELDGLRALLDGELSLCGLSDLGVSLSADSTGIRVRMAPAREKLSAARELSQRENFVADGSQYGEDRDGLHDHTSGLSVYFRAGYRALDLNYEDNAATLKRILDAVRIIERDPRSRLLCVRIIGQTSPEGSQRINEILSQKRGDALKSYLMTRGPIPESRFEVVSYGEAWAELRELVAADPAVPHREEVLDVIDNVPVWDSERQIGRLSALWKIDGERPYWYMYKNLFPKLRNASYVKVYFDDEPDAACGTIDRAGELIAAGDYAGALELLREVKDDERAWAALAVCHAMTGDRAAAQEYLRKVRDEVAGNPAR